MPNAGGYSVYTNSEASLPEPSDWIYCRLVDRGSLIFPRPSFWLGQVEFSERNQEEATCAEALITSMQAFILSEAGEQWERLVRARLLIPGGSIEEARQFGGFHLVETLQAFNAHLALGFSEIRATEAGYLYDIRKRKAWPFLPPWERRSFNGISAITDQLAHHPRHVLNTLYVAPAAFGELGDAFRRSSHWRELAGRSEDEGEALLLYWMSAECLCKQRHDEDIISKLLTACGFPSGRFAQSLEARSARQLAQIPGHRAWRKQLAHLFNDLRIARNSIVHAGYRHVDLPELLRDDQRALGMFVLGLVTRLLAEMALQALNLHRTTLAAMWGQYESILAPQGIVHHVEWVILRLGSDDASRRWAPYPMQSMRVSY